MNKEILSGNPGQFKENLARRYSISQSQIYRRMKSLDMEPTKRNGEVYISSEQLEELDRLDQHLKSGLPLNAYGADVPEGPSGAGESGALAKADPEQISERLESVETLEAHQASSSPEAIAQNLRAAQTKAAGHLIFQNWLAARYVQEPSLLPPDLRDQVLASEEAACPKPVDPGEYARELLALTQLPAACPIT